MTFMRDENKPILGVDVDLTTLRSDQDWWIWLKNMTMDGTLPDTVDEFIVDGNRVDYYLPAHFGKPFNDNVDVLDFWRNEGVYDTIQPVDGAVDAIRTLMRNFNIVFVTHNKGNGGRSKYNNLARHFGKGNFGYVVTKEKYLTGIDALVDDRNDFLNNCADAGMLSIKIDTPFVQKVEPHSDIVHLPNWSHIQDFLLQELYTGDSFK